MTGEGAFSEVEVQAVSRAGEPGSIPFLTSVTPERSKNPGSAGGGVGERMEARQRNKASYRFMNRAREGPSPPSRPALGTGAVNTCWTNLSDKTQEGCGSQRLRVTSHMWLGSISVAFLA